MSSIDMTSVSGFPHCVQISFSFAAILPHLSEQNFRLLYVVLNILPQTLQVCVKTSGLTRFWYRILLAMLRSYCFLMRSP